MSYYFIPFSKTVNNYHVCYLNNTFLVGSLTIIDYVCMTDNILHNYNLFIMY